MTKVKVIGFFMALGVITLALMLVQLSKHGSISGLVVSSESGSSWFPDFDRYQSTIRQSNFNIKFGMPSFGYIVFLVVGLFFVAVFISKYHKKVSGNPQGNFERKFIPIDLSKI